MAGLIRPAAAGPGCQLEAGCAGAPIARVAVARNGTGLLAYMTVVPASRGSGGLTACADHAHAQLDTLLLAGLGPPAPPAREQLPAGESEAGPC